MADRVFGCFAGKSFFTDEVEEMDNKRLLFVVEAMGGGVFTYIVDLANALADTYEIFIAYATRKQTPEDFESYFDKRIHLIRVQNFTRSVDFVKDIKAFWEIKRIAEYVQPDFIHLHSSKAGALGRWAFNGHKIPLFYTPHGYSFLMLNHSRAKRTIYRLIETMSAKRYCTTVSCSEGEHQETLKLTKRALYIDNGINTAELQQLIDSVDRMEKHEFTVFTLGRICGQKNPELFNAIAYKMPDVCFLWIGDGEMRNVLTAPNIEITGWVDRKRALQRSLSADVFVLTSLWEGLPISLLEAMYMKKLCVVNDTIGSRDVIQNRVNGYVCRDVGEFAAAIKSYRDNGTAEIMERARADIETKYNTDVMADKYRRLYSKDEEMRGK